MRVRELTLDSYGAFSNRTIELGAGLSVVLGHNETGKSTALDALADLLWSIPQQSKRAFHFRRQELALSAALVLADGTEVPVQRTTNGLIDTTTRAAVSPLWQGDGDDRGSWRTSFGLSHGELREGGQELFQAKGDLASLIFQARSGQSVHHLLDSLSGRADSLYKEHRGNKGVRARRALAEHEKALQEVERATALAGDITTGRELLRQATEMVEQATKAEQCASVRLSDQEARLRVIADVQQLAKAEARITELRSAGPCLDVADLAVRTDATQRLDHSEHGITEAEGEIATITGKLAAATVDDPVLDDHKLIECLARESTARLDDAEASLAARAETERIEAEARTLLVGLTGPDDRTVDVLLDTLWVGVDRIVELDTTAAALIKADDVLTTHQRQAEATEDRESTNLAPETPDADLVESVREAVTAIEAEDSVVAAFRRTTEAETQARQEHVRLLTEAGLPAHIRLGALPSPESVQSARDELADCEGELHAANKELNDLQVRMADIQRRLSEDDRQEIPDPASVATARSVRDELIAHVVRSWLAGEPSSHAPDLPVRVDRAVHEADRIGDLVAEHLEAAAQRGMLTEELTTVRAAADTAVGAVAEAEAKSAATQQAWKVLWAPSGARCPTPTEAGTFRDLLGEALAAEGRASASRDALDGLRPEVGQRRDYLARLLDEASRPRPDADVDSLLEAAKQLLDEDDKAREARAVSQKMLNLRQTAERELARARKYQEQVAAEWRAKLAVVGLHGLSPTGWYERRDVVNKASTMYNEAIGRRKQAQRLDKRHQKFVEELTALTARLGIEDYEDPTDALDALSTRVQAALAAKGAADNLHARLESLGHKLDGLTKQRCSADADLDDLRKRVGTADLDGAAERGAELVALADRIRQHAEVVHAALPQSDLRELVIQLGVADEQQLRIDVETARQGHERAAEEHAGALRRYGELSHRDGTLTSQPGAADLHAKAHEHLALLADEVEEYLVAEIQRTILRDELEAYERKHASPLLDTAGRILEELTGGRYVALRTLNDARGRSLRIVSADEHLREPGELSEGTADQVFLALRLAGIESLQNSRQDRGLPTLPVVFDDVLMTFDDTRAAAALTVMARLAHRWQVVVFSHHNHIRHVAEELALDNLTVCEMAAPSSIDSTRTPAEVRDTARENAMISYQTASASHTTNTYDPSAVRAWARRTGRPVADRGRIPQDVVDAYEAVHS